MCEDAFDHFLNCLPPKRMQGSSYMNSEPHHHNKRGQEVCIAGLEVNGKFYAQYGTAQEFDQNKLFIDLPKI